MAWGDFTNPDAWKSAMANLLRRGGEVTDYIQQAPSKAGQAILDAGQRQQALMNEAFDPTGKTLIRNPQAANQAAMNLLEGPLSVAPVGMTRADILKGAFDKIENSIKTLKTPDGYTFYEMPNGSIVDNIDPNKVDMSWENLSSFKNDMGDFAYQKGNEIAERKANISSYDQGNINNLINEFSSYRNAPTEQDLIQQALNKQKKPNLKLIK